MDDPNIYQAIAVNPLLTYLLLNTPMHGKLLVAAPLARSFLEMLELSLDNITFTTFHGSDLLNCKYKSPLIPESPEYPILAASYVSGDSGTGLVHCAPGHGLEDYGLLSAHHVSPFSPVDDKGTFTAEVQPPSLRGLSVLDEGNKAVIDLLEESGALIHQHPYKHKYPYDWRSKEPVIVRATEQWFANVESIKDSAVNAIKGIKMIPDTSAANLSKIAD